MIGLVEAEFLKLRTTRTTWAFLGATALLTVAIVSLPLFLGDTPKNEHDAVSTIATANVVALIVLVLGTVGMTGEYRHSTITSTFLAAPVRWRVVLAKAIAYALAGMVFAACGAVLAGLSVLIWESGQPAALHPTSSHAVSLLVGDLGNAALYGALGVGIGALVRSQIASVAGVFVWFFVLEPLLATLSSAIGDYDPSGAFSALTGGDVNDGPLSQGGGAVVLALWVIAFVAAGAIMVERTDVN